MGRPLASPSAPHARIPQQTSPTLRTGLCPPRWTKERPRKRKQRANNGAAASGRAHRPSLAVSLPPCRPALTRVPPDSFRSPACLVRLAAPSVPCLPPSLNQACVSPLPAQRVWLRERCGSAAPSAPRSVPLIQTLCLEPSHLCPLYPVCPPPSPASLCLFDGFRRARHRLLRVDCPTHPLYPPSREASAILSLRSKAPHWCFIAPFKNMPLGGFPFRFECGAAACSRGSPCAAPAVPPVMATDGAPSPQIPPARPRSSSTPCIAQRLAFHWQSAL